MKCWLSEPEICSGDMMVSARNIFSALHLDHLVLTVSDVESTVRFYESVLGMQRVVFGKGRVAEIRESKDQSPPAWPGV